MDAVGALDRSGLDDFLVGVGDELSLGITEGVRSLLDIDDVVDRGGAYDAGQYTVAAAEVAAAGGAVVVGVKMAAKKLLGKAGKKAAKRAARAGDRSPKAIEAAIKRQKQLEHVGGTKEHARRVSGGGKPSTFSSEGEAIRRTREAYRRGKPAPGRPQVREHDFGRPVGTSNGGPASRVRVHQDEAGRIHGHPF